MNSDLSARLDRLARRLPSAYPGPGGAIAVLRRGEILLRHAWGFANAERHIAFTPRTLFRVCSITKQFTCATLLQICPDPADLDAALHALLPRLVGPTPTILQLAHNQSGLRDYWAVAMLLGAGAELRCSSTDFGGDFNSSRWRRAERQTSSGVLSISWHTKSSGCNASI